MVHDNIINIIVVTEITTISATTILADCFLF